MSVAEWKDGDYPTVDALERIESWPADDVNGALTFAAELWHYPDFGVSYELSPEERAVVHADEGERYLRLATGGWSGNEEIVSALRSNIWVMAHCWRLSARGGLHIFQFVEV